MTERSRATLIFEIFVIALASSLAIWIYFFAEPMAGMSIEAKRTLGIVVLALGIWAIFPQRAFWPSVFIIALLFLTQLSTSIEELILGTQAAYGGSSGLWSVLAGFTIAHALDVSGLSKRMALGIVSRFGGNAKRIIFAIAIANLAIAPLSPSTTAKAFVLLPICISIAEAFNAKKGVSNFGKCLFLMSAAANNICASAFMQATVPNRIAATQLAGYGVPVSILDWLVLAFPPNMFLLIASFLIIVRLFPPETNKIEGGEEKVHKLTSELGPMGRGEWLSVSVFAAALCLWILEGFNASFPGGTISLILCLALFIPRIGVIKAKRFGKAIPLGPIALFAAAFYLADAIRRTGAFGPLVTKLFDILGISSLPFMPTLAVVVFLSIFLHVFFTSTTAYATVVMPVVITVAQLGGLPIASLGLPVAITLAYAFILPMNTIPNVVMLQPGYFRQRNMIAYGLLLAVAATLVILVVAIPYWRLIGFFP